jgi:hypothetical protein
MRSPVIAVILLIACSVLCGFCPQTCNASVQSTRQKAQGSLRGDWYDHRTETFRPPTMTETLDHPLRKSGRLASPSRAWNWNWNFPRWNLGLSTLRSFLTYALMSVLVLALVTSLLLLVWHFSGHSRLNAKKHSTKEISIDPARFEDLPFAMADLPSDPLSRARIMADSGDYEQAIIYVSCYMLLALDQARRLFLQKGKTNRTYLFELHDSPDLQVIMSHVILKFEQTYFGRKKLTRQEFEPLWAELEHFHHLLRPVPPSQLGQAKSAEFVNQEKTSLLSNR